MNDAAKVSDQFTIGTASKSMALGRVFIVDDEEHVRKAVGLVLIQGGYEVLEAADGEEAIAAIQSYPAVSQSRYLSAISNCQR